MMGTGHAISGAAVWLAGCAVARVCGGDPGLAVVAVGTAVCSGWALAPDLDHPGSVLARSAGPVTKVISHVVGWFGAWVHVLTKTAADRPDLDGHRTITHTLAWALLWGGLAALGQQHRYGPWVAAVLVFFATTVALRAVLKRKSDRVWKVGRGRNATRIPVPFTVGLVLATVAYGLTPAQGWWLGLAVAVGSLTHCLGDALTNSGCPILWPIRIQRRAWYAVGPPPRWRFATGGAVEVRLVQPLLLLVCAVSLLVVGWPYLGPALDRDAPVAVERTSEPE